MSPRRIQRKRVKGWRMPEGAVYVGRPTKWGNPWLIRPSIEPTEHEGRKVYHLVHGHSFGLYFREDAAYWAARRYMIEMQDALRYAAREELAGKDLACWCPLNLPCHADVLLEIANGGTT